MAALEAAIKCTIQLYRDSNLDLQAASLPSPRCWATHGFNCDALLQNKAHELIKPYFKHLYYDETCANAII
jgi:hypothetical protein